MFDVSSYVCRYEQHHCMRAMMFAGIYVTADNKYLAPFSTLSLAPVKDLQRALVKGNLESLNPVPWAIMSGNCLVSSSMSGTKKAAVICMFTLFKLLLLGLVCLWILYPGSIHVGGQHSWSCDIDVA